ncbi:hypothetical protein WAK64_16875 [Bacillus spongiae]|uniref:YhfM-like domain-containing protein n=1 Tax=Bacillus spongiae TaxID=2683610 RepID=A0ABU8HI29_9BACI
MRKIILFLSITLLSVILFGCQSEENPTKKTEPNISDLKSEDNDNLIIEGEIEKISISKSKGVNPTVFEEDKVFETFKSIFSAAMKEPGDVNILNPEFYLDVVYTNDNQQSFHLWLGEKGQKSTLMNTDETTTIYTVPKEMTDKLIALVK